MKYVGVDLHKHGIVLCVVSRRGRRTKVVCRRRFACRDTDAMRQFFARLGRFEVVVEATAAHEWFFLWIEELADRVVLAHPKKLRNILAPYNADVRELFTQRGEADRQLQEFAQRGPSAEQEARAVLESIPQVGPVTIDVVLSELGDWRRFGSQKRVVAFAGLDPGMRTSADKRQDLHISKDGSRLSRWVLIQAAWRLVTKSPRWHGRWERLWANTGSKKKATVAIARRRSRIDG